RRATTDARTIREWGGQFPVWNLGIARGDNLLPLDWDGRSGGNETSAALCDRLGPRPPTVTVRSGSGDGWHEYYRIPAGLNWPLHPVAGLDLPGFVVAPPSTHRSGGLYEFVPGCGVGEIEIAPLPEPWIEFFQEAKRARPSLKRDEFLSG